MNICNSDVWTKVYTVRHTVLHTQWLPQQDFFLGWRELKGQREKQRGRQMRGIGAQDVKFTKTKKWLSWFAYAHPKEWHY